MPPYAPGSMREAALIGRLSHLGLQGPIARDSVIRRCPFAPVLLSRLGIDTGSLQNRPYSVGGLSPVVDPMSRPIKIDVDRGRVGDGIVEADRLDKGPVTGRAAVSGDDAVAGPFLGAHSPQAKFHHAELLPLYSRSPAIAGSSSCGRADFEACTSSGRWFSRATAGTVTVSF